MRYFIFIFSFFISFTALGQKTISITIDDGTAYGRGGYSLEEWNGMLLGHLDEAGIKAVFFVKAGDKTTEEGKYLLDSWNERGHQIANHTYTHPNFNREEVSAEDFRNELLRADSVINGYSNYVKLFRFPYLKEGNTDEKVKAIRAILQEQGYKHGHVTIDASDWYIDSRLRKRLKENPEADLEEFKKFYLEHLFERATYYENLSWQLNGRHIKHTLLLHHNLAAALFLDDLIAMFRAKGWKVISADEAFEDPVYDEVPKHAGESLIWALAKDSGKFEETLRYPAESSKYEKEKMDERGL